MEKLLAKGNEVLGTSDWSTAACYSIMGMASLPSTLLSSALSVTSSMVLTVLV